MKTFACFLLIAIARTMADECKDMEDDCGKLADLCQDPNLKDLMGKKCPKTCGVCTCQDSFDSCTTLANECFDPDFKDLMALKCANTCGLCTEDADFVCSDNAADCAQATDICTESDFMYPLAKRCPKTCGYCELITCKDNADTCPTLAEHCTDASMQDYMWETCPKTCGLCTDDSWFHSNVTEKWFKVIRQKKSWKLMENICAGIGGHLASIHSVAENAFILNLMGAQTPNRNAAWIGLSYDSTTTSLKWSDGTLLDYNNYDNKGNDCYVIQSKSISLIGSWHDYGCDGEYAGICEKYNHVV